MTSSRGHWDWEALEALLLEDCIHKIRVVPCPTESFGPDSVSWRWEGTRTFSTNVERCHRHLASLLRSPAWSVVFQHVGRSSNRVADWLAALSHDDRSGLFRFHEAPMGVLNLLQQDIMGG
ncbi:hypothetical protein V6N13_025232 [Hibiscus sabdariffa]